MKDKSIPVIMCTYRRPERLSVTFDQLGSQIDCKIEVYVWNNNPKYKKIIESTIAEYQNLSITLHNSEKNIGGFARFYMARKLSYRHPAVIFIDDDVELSPKSLSILKNEFEPQTIHSFFTFRFKSKKDFFKRNVPNPGGEADYCGTGGMICDTSIFRDKDLFRCPKEYWFVEDLWLSYYASQILGWKLYRSHTDIKIIRDDKDQYVSLKEVKADFFQYLLATGWSLPALNKKNYFKRIADFF